MHRSQAVGNRICNDRWEEHCRRIHLMKLRNMKPRLDNNQPQRRNHLQQNLKRAQVLLERSSTIERDNRKLLLKMSSIMRRNTLDNKNEVEFKSLNRTKRKQELQQITKENQQILTRIQAKQPAYSHKKWAREYQQSRSYLKNIQGPNKKGPKKRTGRLPQSGGGGGSGPASRNSRRSNRYDDEDEGDYDDQGDQDDLDDHDEDEA